MTSADKTIFNRNFRVNVATILTMISCTATFVWKANETLNEIRTEGRETHSAIQNHVAQTANKFSELQEVIDTKANKEDVDNLRADVRDYSRYVLNKPMK